MGVGRVHRRGGVRVSRATARAGGGRAARSGGDQGRDGEAARERQTAARDELKELEKPAEGDPPTPAFKAQREARVNHLRAAIKADEAIAALKGAESLPKARQLMRERELIDARWAIVTMPATTRACQIEALARQAHEAKKPVDALTVVQKLHEADVKDAEAEFALRQKRTHSEAEMSRLLEQAEKQLNTP